MMEVVKFKEIAEIITGSTPSTKNSNFYDGMYLFVSPADLGSNKWINKSKKHLSQSGFEVSRVIPKNAILLCCIGATIGKVGIAGTDLTTNQQINSIVFDKNKVDPEYGYYYCTTLKETLISKSHSTTLPIISKGKLSELKIPLPPLPTQKKIASILDAADAYRQKTKALIEKYDELTQSLFLDMFGDPVVNEKGWEKVKLSLITNMKAGKFVRASDINSENGEGLFPCYGGNGLRGFVKTYTHDGDFVLIGRQGALCGNVKLAFGKFHATEHAIVCSPKMNFNTEWLYFLLDILDLNKLATGAAQPGLNVSTLNKLEVVFVPLNLQNQFAERIQKIEAQKAQAQESLEKAEELFNSLLGRAFKNKI